MKVRAFTVPPVCGRSALPRDHLPRKAAARPSRVAALAAVLAAANAALLAALLLPTRPAPSPAAPIQRAEAEQVLAEAARLAQAGDFPTLCRSVAATAGPCRATLTTSGRPGADPPVVTAVRQSSHETLVLRVTGTRSDGSPYQTDFPVIRTPTGEARSITAVYWSGMTFLDTPLPCAEPGMQACAQATSRLGP